jgi:hypothetical protein
MCASRGAGRRLQGAEGAACCDRTVRSKRWKTFWRTSEHREQPGPSHLSLTPPQFNAIGPKAPGAMVGELLDPCRREGGINDAAMATWLVASTWAAMVLMGIMVRARGRG